MLHDRVGNYQKEPHRLQVETTMVTFVFAIYAARFINNLDTLFGVGFSRKKFGPNLCFQCDAKDRNIR